MPTKIEWTDETWNPVTGCDPVSAGCTNCYARRMANRLRGRYGYPQDDPFKVTLHPDRIDQPLHWRKPRMIFVCSMGDLFHKDVPHEFIYWVWSRMEIYLQHIFIVLTKRPERMVGFLKKRKVPSHIWLGVSVEDQKTADERIPILLQVPAAVIVVSYEPALGGMVLPSDFLERGKRAWLIIGAETGPQARPMEENWVRKVVLQCKNHNVPLFYKQKMVGKRKISTPILDQKRYVEYPCLIAKQKDS